MRREQWFPKAHLRLELPALNVLGVVRTLPRHDDPAELPFPHAHHALLQPGHNVAGLADPPAQLLNVRVLRIEKLQAARRVFGRACRQPPGHLHRDPRSLAHYRLLLAVEGLAKDAVANAAVELGIGNVLRIRLLRTGDGREARLQRGGARIIAFDLDTAQIDC